MRKNKIIGLGFVVVFLLISTSVYAQKEQKIGYVDLSRLFDEYYKTKDYDKVLEEKNNGFVNDVKAKIEEIKDAEGKLAILNEDKKGELETQITTMKTTLEEFDKQGKINLTKERNEKIREILLEIEKVVSDYAEKNGYSIILNDRVLIFGSQTLDATEEVLKILNSNQPTSNKP